MRVMLSEFNSIGREITVAEIYEWTVNFMQEMSPKRFEENIKFVFKLTFKNLKNSFLKKNKISFYSKKFDDKFYEHYFLELANQFDVPIEQFYDPLNNNFGIKTLNGEYLRMLFRSSQFKKDFFEYLESGLLVENYQKNVKRKVRQLLLKFDPLFDSDQPDKSVHGIRQVQKYFRVNKQCKLPWLKSEILTAIETFSVMVNNMYE